MIKVGFIGWRGMVGSVLMGRMLAEKDFTGYEPTFFTTSQVGQRGPQIGTDTPPLQDAFNIDALRKLDRVATIQNRSIRHCENLVGRATGLMRPLPFEWKIRASLYWTLSTGLS